MQQQGGHVTRYRGPEYPVPVLLHSWCAGTVRNYISAEVAVLGKSGEGLLELRILFYLSFSDDFSDKQAAFSPKMSPRREKSKISLPSHEYSQQLLPRSLSDQAKQFKAAFI